MPLAVPKNVNYAATVVVLKVFVDLAGCDRVKHAVIFGNAVIVSKDAQAGTLGLYFPPETALSHEFLAANNLYRKPEWGNVDPEQKGFFEEQGRVKAVRFRGFKSEGFFIPISSVNFIPQGNDSALSVGDVFDTLNGVEICRKYIPKGTPAGTQSASSTKAKQSKLEDSIVDNQFRRHFVTEQLRRNVHKIRPSDFISITDKWHGTSVVIGKLLVKRTLNWKEKVAKLFSVSVNESEYGLVYSSRNVIMGVNGVDKNVGVNYYSTDIYGDVAKEVADKIPNGFTLYGEIVGFGSDGGAIQKGYEYGCVPGEHKFMVYRVTSTSSSGFVVELSTPQLYEFCTKYGIDPQHLFYYGPANRMFHDSQLFQDDLTTWQARFLTNMEQTYANDGDCPHNPKGTPAEGVVVRLDRLSECENFKLKNFRFLTKESKDLDAGVVDSETAQSLELVEEAA